MTILSKAGNGAIHNTRIDFLNTFVIQTVTSQITGTEAFEEHVRIAQQAAQHLLPLRRTNVQGDTPLVTVQHQVPVAHAVFLFREEAPGAIATHIFNLNYICTIIAQQHTAVLTGQPFGKIYNLNSC